jgi:hypothetical protein
MPHPLRHCLTIAQVCRLLGANHVTIWRQVKNGAFGPFEKPSKVIRVPISAIENKYRAFSRDEIERACVERY